MPKTNNTLSPSDFVALVNQGLEHILAYVVLEGEVADIQIRRGRWVYLKIKDSGAVVDCFGTAQLLPGPIQAGVMLKLTGRPKLHPQFGFSLQLYSLQPVGKGSIIQTQQLLHQQLLKEGLLAAERKRPLPYPPTNIALVTSSEGAAIADFLKIIENHWPYLLVNTYDVSVQGEAAVGELCQAFASINQCYYDAVVVIRGGGSSEDLAVFNHEQVVRAIAGSRSPTLVAIGHQPDETLAELVADRRASTPSSAAEVLVPTAAGVSRLLDRQAITINNRLDDAIRMTFEAQASLATKLANAVDRILQTEQRDLQLLEAKLSRLSPNFTLKRGYSLVKRSGKLISRSQQLRSNDSIELVFFDGVKKGRVE